MPEIETTQKRSPAPRRRPPKKRKKMGAAETFFSGIFPWKGDSTGEAVRKIILLISIIVLFTAGFIMLNFYVFRDQTTSQEVKSYQDQKKDNPLDEKITVILKDNRANGNSDTQTEQQQAEILADYKELYEKNNDLVGWVEIKPWIQMPVVQTDNNEFYLHHTFEKGPNDNGTIFADYQGKISPTEMPGNLLIYGHNLITNNYFQPLVHYRKEGMEFLRENYIIKFDTLYNRNKYFIFAVFLTNTNEQHGKVFNYWDQVYFHTKSEFDNYVAEALDRSYFYTGVDLEYGDELITLSTCDFSMFSDMRLVVMGRKVRDGENPTLDTSTFIDNTGFEDGKVRRKMFEAYYKNYDTEWLGRKWDPAYIKDFKDYYTVS